MPVTKFTLLILKIFMYSALVSTAVFFIWVYINAGIVNILLPADMHIVPTLSGSAVYGVYTGLQLSLFFTTFTLLIIRLSIFSGIILTMRDIIRYYKKFIFSSLLVTGILVCSLCVYFSHYSQNRGDIAKGLICADIVTYALPCFWLILTVALYRNYQLKLNEPDGSKDRSWLEGQIEK
jgi:hypothetical protein